MPEGSNTCTGSSPEAVLNLARVAQRQGDAVRTVEAALAVLSADLAIGPPTERSGSASALIVNGGR